MKDVHVHLGEHWRGTNRENTLLLLFFIWEHWVAFKGKCPTIPRLDLNLKIFRVGVGISHLMIPGLPPKPAGVITAAAVNWVCCYDCYGAWNTRQWGTSLCLWSGWFLTLTQHRKEREAHQHTKQLHHELEEELEKLKSSEFSVGNSSTCCIVTTWIDARNLWNHYWVDMFVNMYHPCYIQELKNAFISVWGFTLVLQMLSIHHSILKA